MPWKALTIVLLAILGSNLMSIGTSSGEQYGSEIEALMANRRPSRATEKPAGEFNSNPGTQVPYDENSIDRDHHVPLVASALTDDNGQMYGMAIDHRVPPKPEFEKHLWDHEAYENEYMNHLTKIGYTSQDAYHKAHDWSTQRESAAVEA